MSATSVLFIVGKGRSGTTLLDTLLGQVDVLVSTGELHRLWSWGLVGGYRCGCGAPVPDCPFWTAVEERVVAAVPWAADRRRAAAVLARALSWPRAPQVLAARLGAPPGRALARAGRLLDRLYAAVAAEARAEAVVDSSKWPLHPGLLGLLDGVIPTGVQLVRDPRGVAHSYRRGKETGDAQPDMPRFGALHTVASWSLRNLAAETALALSPRAGLRLRYEDLVTDPGRALADITAALLAEPSALDFLDGRRAQIAPTHTVGGNPGRFETGTLELSTDTRWHTGLPAGPRRITTALTAPLLVRYGYPLGGRR